MKFTIERVAIAVLLVVIIVFLLRDCSRPSEEKEADRKQQYETEIAILKADKTSIQARQDSLVQKVVLRTRNDSVQIAVQEIRIKTLNSKLASQRPKVIEKIQADTAVLSYVNTLEEIVTELQSTVDTLKAHKEFQRKINEDLIVAEIDEDKIEASMNLQYAMRVSDLEKAAKKRERKSRLAKVLIPIAAVAGLLVGSAL